MTTLQSSDYNVIVLIPSHITENKYFKNNLSNTAKSSKYCYYQVSFLTYIPTYFETHSLVFFFVSVTVDGDDGDVGEVGGDGEE